MSNGACLSNGQACEIHDNFVSVFPGILTLDQCRLLCTDEAQCVFLTYFGPDNFPLVNTCMIFTDCPILDNCVDCVTEKRNCDSLTIPLCSSPVETEIGQNFVGLVTDIESERDCRAECFRNSQCDFYTHRSLVDAFDPGSCWLLSGPLHGPVVPCDHCMTGASNCTNSSR